MLPPEDLAMIICRLCQCHESMKKPNESSCIPHNRKHGLLSFVMLAVRLPCHICWLHFGNTSACLAAAGTDALCLQLRHHDGLQYAFCTRKARPRPKTQKTSLRRVRMRLCLRVLRTSALLSNAFTEAS